MMAKRVVTGHDGEGKAIVVSQDVVEPVTSALVRGYEFRILWGGDDVPSFPEDGSHPATAMYFPPVGGFRFMTVTFPPDSEGSLDDIDFEAVDTITFSLPEADWPTWYGTGSPWR